MLIVEHSVVFLEVVVEDTTLASFEEVAMNGIAESCCSFDVVVSEDHLIATYDSAESIAEFNDKTADVFHNRSVGFDNLKV